MKIVFTAGMDAERVSQQEVWQRIAQHEQPDVLMLLGDQICMDWALGGAGAQWRALLAQHPEDGLRAFAQDMHQRYAQQWNVQAFRELICGFAGRADPARLLLTWSDHNYAWGDALGVEDAGDGEGYGVPARVKAASRRIFAQFERQLRTAAAHDAYPAQLPPGWNALPSASEVRDLFWSGPLGGGEGPYCLLLDTCWHREARADGASLLGAAQGQALYSAAAEEGAGPLIVAGGLPMVHHYLLSQRGWRAEGKPSYVDYERTVQAARRPVLYLGGDVRGNAWSGRLPRLDGTPSAVVQMLASGAALGRFGPQRFAPRYGVVVVPQTWRTGGIVQAQLWCKPRTEAWQADPLLPPLPFDGHDWTQPLHAQAMGRIEAAADDRPVTILAARVRASGFKGRASVEMKNGLAQLDEVYAAAPLGDGHAAEPLQWTVAADGSALLQCQADMGLPGEWPAATLPLLHSAFERALAQPTQTSVVLFVHGFGKTPALSVAQAYGLRASYPACEPILYAWEAGRSGSVLAALTGVPRARLGAQGGSYALATLLYAFNLLAAEPAYKRLTKVVLARSAGCLALHHALQRLGGDAAKLANVDRVVLSAPLLKASEYRSATSFGGVPQPVILTRNRRDETLRLADWFDGAGPLLGAEEGFEPQHPAHVCVDFTDSEGVGTLHDYLLLPINARQYGLQQLLLCRPEFRWDEAVAAGMVTGGEGGIFHVL